MRRFPAGHVIEPAREMVLGEDDDLEVDPWELLRLLVATATIMGIAFPEYEQWHEEALATNYGRGERKPFRLADRFHQDPAEPQGSGATNPAPGKMYQLKVTLKDIKPPIWRRLLVPDCTLDNLHEIIQVAMGWENYHLYAFSFDGREFTRPDMDQGELNMEDASSTMLSDVIAKAKQKFAYQYDFGDDWEHEILVEKIVEPEPGKKYPLCVKGSRACPPEDVGGPWGYAEYLEAMAVPLAQLKPSTDTDKPTRQAVEDWHYWINQGDEF